MCKPIHDFFYNYSWTYGILHRHTEFNIDIKVIINYVYLLMGYLKAIYNVLYIIYIDF